jgi:polar amino acid transport system permease protein
MRVVMPPLVNYLLSLFKDTSLLSVITIQELLFSGLLIASTTYNHFVIFTEIAIIYFLICYPVALLATYLESVMTRRRRVRWRDALKQTIPKLSSA